MARSGQYSRSFLGASDEVPGIYCEPCHKAGYVALAEGYCVDCPEYLCGLCYKIHRQLKPLANYVLLDQDSMPLTTDFSRRVLDVCETKCTIHPNKVIELFCETCDKLVCHICVATDHCQCGKVKHIPDIVKDIEHTKALQEFNEDIMSIANALSEHEKKLQANVTSSSEMRELAKRELIHWRAEVKRFFDQLEKNMDEQITALEKRNRDTLKATSDRLDQMNSDLDLIKNDMKSKNTGQRCEQFIAMKQSQKKLMTFQDQFDKIQKELRIQHYALVLCEQIQAMMRTTTESCRVATARFESEFDIKTIANKTEPSIFGLTIMHEHYCVALDNDNKSIKVIDTTSKCVISEIAIEAERICSVTSVSDDQVAVSVSVTCIRHQMQFYTVSASGVIQRVKKPYAVNEWYSGMVYCAGNIYGVLSTRIDKLDMTGKIIRTIQTNDTGGMTRIALSPDGQTLYVTDFGKHSVTSMTLDGEIKTVYKDKDLKQPLGITVDKHGYVYVCSCGTKNVQQLTANLSKVQVFVGDNYENISYSSTENKLYISEGEHIHQYSLDLK